jgi:hypothetical protein
MAFIGQLTGKKYESLEAMLYEERREAMRRAKPDEAEKAFADVPTEKLKAILTAAQMGMDDTRIANERSKVDVTVWLNLHPEYVNSDRNSNLMRHELGGSINPTVAELEEAFQSLLPTGLLELNQAVLAKQEKAAMQDRANKIAENGGPLGRHTEEEMEKMSLHELRLRANGVFISR